MVLTWPIDRKEPSEIPAFDSIIAEFPGASPVLKYLCWRFDPKSTEVRNLTTLEDKRRMAEERSGWNRPDPKATLDEDTGNFTFNDEWEMYSKIESMFFELISDLKYKFMVAIEINIDQCNAIIMEPIPYNMDAETKGKILLNQQKAQEGNAKAFERLDKLVSEMSDGDPDAAKNIEATSHRKRLKRDLSGNVIDE